VIGCVGIDENDDIWVLPDLVWDRMETDGIVEDAAAQFKAHKPQLWWMESELISKSFGPFLRKRMHEEQIYTTIDPVTCPRTRSPRAIDPGPHADAQGSFPGVRAVVAGCAQAQLLKFPFGTHDDFVDWLAHIGMGLTKFKKIRNGGALRTKINCAGPIPNIGLKSYTVSRLQIGLACSQRKAAPVNAALRRTRKPAMDGMSITAMKLVWYGVFSANNVTSCSAALRTIL
jgi:hypothetical protein